MIVEDFEAYLASLEILLLGEVASAVEPLDACLDHEHVLVDRGAVPVGLEHRADGAFAGELVQAAVGDCQHKVRVTLLADLQVKDATSLRKL